MFAVIETGGHQFQVEPGQTIRVDRLQLEVGDMVTIERVLMIGQEQGFTVGKPLVEGARVIAKVTGQGRSKKVMAFKYHNKERLRHKHGHRQQFTRLLIDRIEA
jgi:large subunit ribosomal protein L21